MRHQYQKIALIATFLFCLGLVVVSSASSEDSSNQAPISTSTISAEILPTLPQVTVTGVRIAPMTGATVIDREMIENLPARNGTLNEILSTVPGIQFSEDSLSSSTGGEITPPSISISGSRFYENNFTIDGFSNNSALDPATTSTSDIFVLPGHPQQIFLDPHLIEQVTVYDSNIPAEHGGFTGGMIDAVTLDPMDEFWGNVNFRTTSDNFTKFHIHPDDLETFETSETEKTQPKFFKYDAGFTLNTPIGTDMGLLASYQRLYSEIPLSYINGKTDQTRSSENFFLKYGYHISNKSRLYLTGIYAPFRNEYFLSSLTQGIYRASKDTFYNITGGAYSLTSKLEHDIQSGSLEVGIAYTKQKTEREAPQDKFKWHTSTPSIDWETGIEGGSGNLKTSQEDIELNSTFTSNNFTAWEINHQVKLGAELEHSKQSYKRPETSYYYTYHASPSSDYYVQLDPTIECNGLIACIDNEQYLVIRYVYGKGFKEASYNRYAAFIQDSMSWKRLEIFPGLRLSTDTYTDNTNIAPRFSAAYDVFGNRGTILFGGANRYYSQNLLTHRLREAFTATNFFEYRESLESDFTTPLTNTGYKYLWKATELATPYSDELTLGLTQKVFGGEVKVQYIERNGKDELARERTDVQEDGYRYYLFNNNGRTKHESYKASWNRTWRKHYFEVNGTYQKTTTSNLLYSGYVDSDNIKEIVMYDGKILQYEELPRTNFNRPKVINLIYSGQFPLSTTFTNTTKYRSSYEYKKFLEWYYLSDGTRIPSYEEKSNKSSIIFDWRFAWAIPSVKSSNLVIALDIYNVFNEKAFIKSSDDEYEIGRQYWLGMELLF